MRTCVLPVFLVMFLLSACGVFDVRIEPITTTLPTFTPESPLPAEPPTSTATQQASPTPALEVPTQTLAVPTSTVTQPAAATSAAPTTAAGQTVKIFLIALEDNGVSGTAVGCGDSAIPVDVRIPRTQGVLRAALEKLLSAKQQFYGESGYYNALYQSSLQVVGVTIEEEKAIIRLTGTLMLGGACDAPRVEAQIEQTALQFSTVKDVAVFVNDIPLEEALSTR